ncbi:MAG: alpha/beta fold hydrolase [Alphaproteobacteria bacterium]|nr:alpha/beta fold hydrolase [Alphaproteobacteria bacterium]
MATFLLIHGAWQGAWAWDRLVPLLEEAGHAAVAVDLPGDGHDDTPPETVTTMLCAEKVAGLIDNATPPVILVGHSMGGTVASQASELRPDKVSLAIYLCAFLLGDGDSCIDFYARAWEDWMTGAHARVTHSEDGHVSVIDPEAAVEVFYNTADPADARAAAARLTPQPESSRRSPLQLTEERYGTVPRVYIETLQDRSVFNELQKKMYSETPVDRLYSLDTDHAPQLCAPEKLAALLIEAAGEYT